MSAHAARKLLSIAIPVYNEGPNIEPLLSRLHGVLDHLPSYDYEVVFTDNASTDDTFEKLTAAARDDPRIRVLRFSRNFGFQQSILANYLEARGDAAIQIDADLQDPPELIPEMVRLWEAGNKVVYGIRRKRVEPWPSRMMRWTGYRIIAALSDAETPRDAGDFRLIDRAVIEALRATNDHSPYLRGLIASFGYAQTGIHYDRAGRTEGRSKFNALSLIRLGLDGVISQSVRPLEFITLFGFLASTLSLFGAAIYLVVYLVSASDQPQGFTTIVFLILITQGFNTAFMGVIGEYVGRIYKNSRTLPVPIIEYRVEHPEAHGRHPIAEENKAS